MGNGNSKSCNTSIAKSFQLVTALCAGVLFSTYWFHQGISETHIFASHHELHVEGMAKDVKDRDIYLSNNMYKVNVAVLITLRNRDRQFALVTNYIQDYIAEHDKSVHLAGIVAVDQLKSDNQPFAKTILYNIAADYVLSSNRSVFQNVTHFVLHDVDWVLLPPASYAPMRDDIHLQHLAPIQKPFSTGGISVVSVYGYKHCLNGFSNHYRGWCCEDEDLWFRMKHGAYLPGCALNVSNFMPPREELPALRKEFYFPTIADLEHPNASARLADEYHSRGVTSDEDTRLNRKREHQAMCDKEGYWIRNDGLNTVHARYRLVGTAEIFGKLTTIKVEVGPRDLSWQNVTFPPC